MESKQTQQNDLSYVMHILNDHYLNVGSDGYDPSIYQDEYLTGMIDGVELVKQALKMYQTDPQTFTENYINHKFKQSKTLSQTPVHLYTLNGYYQPKNQSEPIKTFLFVFVPELKYSHCYQLKTILEINDLDQKTNPNENIQSLQNHNAIFNRISQHFNDEASNLTIEDLKNYNVMNTCISNYNKRYYIDPKTIKKYQTTQAILDLSIQKILEKKI